MNRASDDEDGWLARVVGYFLAPAPAGLAMAIAAIAGLVALWATPREEEPQIVVPLADVFIEAPGLSAVQIERHVATRVEKLLAQIDGVESLGLRVEGAVDEIVPFAEAVARAAAAVVRLKSTLVGELTAAIAQGGPENAIGVCRDRAPAIAQAVSQPGLRVGRSSHKLRNPANAAPDWAAPLLAAWVAGERSGEPTALALEGGRTGYVEPLVTAPMCLACHGESIAPAVASKIAALYPEDRATGFRAGELRGIAWVEVEAGGAP